MIFTVDIGNTTITMGLFSPEGELTFRGEIKTDRNKTPDQIAIDVLDMFRLKQADIQSVTGAAVSSVVPPMTAAMGGAIQLLCGVKPMIVGPGVKTGMNIRAEVHNQLGADIVATSVGALQKYKAPIIVIDMGTATTMIVLDETGALIGGSISPGVKISMDALTGRTALLPGLQLDQPKKAIGRNTIDCMRSGIMLGAACMLDGMVERMEEELGAKTTVVITGGIARFVVPMCRTPMVYDKDLLLKGLAILYRENTRS